MANELAPIDITKTPELAWLVEEVETTGKRRRFTRGSRTIAVVEPAEQAIPTPRRRGGRTSASDPLWRIIGTVPDDATGDAVVAELARRRRQGLDIVAATAGIAQYDGPVLTREQEKAAFTQAVADEVTEHLGD